MLLAHILTIHPEIRRKYRIGTMVGTSSQPGNKQDFLDLPETDGDLSLKAFRTGEKNLIVATSVLEEGLDVPACNLVICVDAPKNLRTFIQRRGRARMRESRLYHFVDEQGSKSSDWERLEAEMKRHYEDDLRQLQDIKALEDADLDVMDYPVLHGSTGARLTIHDAKSHLQHFCATLSSRKFVNWQPEYIIEEIPGFARPGEPNMLRATVLLPIILPPNLRQATGIRTWLSEKHACMDAAFQAYQALYMEGLVDEHLVPLRDTLERDIEQRPSLKQVRALRDPWVKLVHAWELNHFSKRVVKVSDQSGSVICEMKLTCPGELLELGPIDVWWDPNTKMTLLLENDSALVDRPDGAEDDTRTLLSVAHGHRAMEIEDDCIVRFISPASLSMSQIGCEPLTADVAASSHRHLVRDGREYARHQPYYFDTFLSCKPSADLFRKTYKGFEEDPEDEPYVAVRKWPKRSGLFHRPARAQQTPSTKPYSLVLPAKTSTVDSIPLEYAQFGLLIPCLLHVLGIHLLATELSQSLLSSLKLSDVSMVVEAICAASARTPKNYERVEFLGDSILKTCLGE